MKGHGDLMLPRLAPARKSQLLFERLN